MFGAARRKLLERLFGPDAETVSKYDSEVEASAVNIYLTMANRCGWIGRMVFRRHRKFFIDYLEDEIFNRGSAMKWRALRGDFGPLQIPEPIEPDEDWVEASTAIDRRSGSLGVQGFPILPFRQNGRNMSM